MSRHPDSYEEASRVMFETLSSRYKDDGALFRVLFEQQNIDDGSAASKLAARLLLEQIMIWGKNGKKSEVFMPLNLHEAKGELFESPAFRLWFSFVTVNDKKIRAKQFESMRTVLSSHYKGDGALFKALLERLKIDDDRFSRKFAEEMLRAQMGEEP